MAFYRTSPFSTPPPQSLPSPSIVGRRLHKFRLRLTTASVCGTIDCSLRLPTLIPDTAPSLRCRARCLNLRSQTISAFPFRCLFPTPPASGATPFQSGPQPPLAFPTRQCRSATFRTPKRTVAIHTTRCSFSADYESGKPITHP